MVHEAPLMVSFEDLSYSVRVRARSPGGDGGGGGVLGGIRERMGKARYEDKVILHGLSGAFRPGRLTAILGPSGSGKTTLLNLLAGYESSGTATGSIWVNGRPATGASMRLLAGYVSQDDVILPTQTVREAIEMSIRLRPPPLSQAADAQASLATAVDGLRGAEEGRGGGAEKGKGAGPAEAGASHAIALLGLERCQHTRVGDSAAKGISGGERKRTAIAQEWVTQAPILFLDEPTSGLDAHSALMVTRQLKSIADRGRTVVAVVHQPSSEMFELIDDLLVLLDGRIVYFGERAGLVDYVAGLGAPCGMYSNPADHVFNAVLFSYGGEGAPDRAVRLQGEWVRSAGGAAMRALIERPETAPVRASQFRRTSPPLTQLRYLTWRAALNARRNRLVLGMRLGQAVFFGLLLGLIFLNTDGRPVNVQQQNFSGAMFFMSTTSFLLSVLSVVNTFSQERLVFLRESQGGYYGLPAYFLSKNIVELPIQVVTPIINSVIAYWLLGLRQDGLKYVLFALTCIGLNLCGFSFGLFLASSFKDISAVLVALPIMFLPALLFGGLLVNTGNSTVWLRWIQWISPIKYGYTSMMKNQFTGYVVDGRPIGDAYLEQVNLGPFSVGVNIAFILVLSFIAWVAAYLSLMRLARQGRSPSFTKNAEKHLRQQLEGPPDPRFAQGGKEMD
ncbi:hypothetical protein H4R18_000992 [Coemansia javaensis]|uniref:ABC transporter domain-containing protein n=1 Tax=Coemansia javaensis TaxID=2761396 RepID=A0A9W8HMS5_9FUNG|nr:hypothetical protein H4R18_000992 [Coemansia javaensis]